MHRHNLILLWALLLLFVAVPQITNAAPSEQYSTQDTVSGVVTIHRYSSPPLHNVIILRTGATWVLMRDDNTKIQVPAKRISRVFEDKMDVTFRFESLPMSMVPARVLSIIPPPSGKQDVTLGRVAIGASIGAITGAAAGVFGGFLVSIPLSTGDPDPDFGRMGDRMELGFYLGMILGEGFAVMRQLGRDSNSDDRLKLFLLSMAGNAITLLTLKPAPDRIEGVALIGLGVSNSFLLPYLYHSYAAEPD